MRTKCFWLLVIVFTMAAVSPLFAVGLPPGPQSLPSGFWQWNVLACASDGCNGAGTFVGDLISCDPQATDGFDGEEGLVSYSLLECTTFAAIYQVEGTNGWNGTTGMYMCDLIPLLAPGQTMSWQVYVWATPDTASDFNTIDLMTSGSIVSATDNIQAKLTLKDVPGSVTSAPSVGTVWDLSTNGLTLSLPIYTTDDGLTGYHFELTATCVPEPSAFGVLACGFVGFLVQARKHRNQ